MIAMVGEKRSAGDANLTSAEKMPITVEDVCTFVASVIGQKEAAAVVNTIREHGIDGEVLMSMSEAELKGRLGITKFGLCRKISLRLSSFSPSRSTPPESRPPSSAATTFAPLSRNPHPVLAVAQPGGALLPQQTPPAIPAGLSAPPCTSLVTPLPYAPPGLTTPQAVFSQAPPAPMYPIPLQTATSQQQTPAGAAWLAPSQPASAPAVPHPAATPAAARPAEATTAAQETAVDTHAVTGTGASTTEKEKEEKQKEEGETPAEDLASRALEEQAAIDAQLSAEAECIATGKWVLGQLKSRLTTPGYSSWADRELVSARLEEVAELGRVTQAPGMTVVVVGNTGAGKSTMLNTLLGERNVLPTNGMRACTAALVELTYLLPAEAPSGMPYVGEVDFISVEEWENELDLLFQDLTQQDGRAILHVSDSTAHNYGSWCKVVAVYGESYTHSTVEEAGRRRPPTVEQLRRKLKADRSITHKLGTTFKLTAPDAMTFKKSIEQFVDSSNEGTKSFWPIVKMMRMRSCKWNVLKTGAKLVDAPGVRDDNSARDGVVQKYFKEADSIWIVSHINRAVNDKTAKDMLGESFRRQILMDGQYGSMIFVATQSDNLLQTEIAQNLGLPEGTPIHECAAKRNEFTKQRIQEDFLDGLEEMQRMSGAAVNREELRAKFHLPVFTVSGMDFQKLSGVRETDGEAKVWTDIEGTEIPALTRYVHNAALQKRRTAIRTHAEAIVNLCDSIHAVATDDSSKDAELLCRVKQAFTQAVSTRISRGTQELLEEFDLAVKASFASLIGTQLLLGAEAATKEVMTTVQGWGRKPREGGMQWGTYKAHTRRDGVFRLDMNELMAEPVYRAVSSYWEQTFSSSVQTAFQTIQQRGTTLVKELNSSFYAQLQQSGMAEVAAQLESFKGSVESKAIARVTNSLDQAKEFGRSQQREVNRTITPSIQEHMRPGYATGTAEAGPGSHARRKEIIEEFVDRERQAMFSMAIQPVVTGLEALRQSLVSTVQQGLNGILKEMEVGYSSFWSSASAETMEARRKLAPEVHMLKMEATTSLRRLLKSQGEQFEEPDVNDEDIQVVPSDKGAGGIGADVINLCDGDDCENLAIDHLPVKHEQQG
mmetsp:Transcript_19729/g.54804  ORF Transcript_19729/g.54804 Transcript_19729/m.54804 type:complete len:1112 (-) Transcript_19729:310-3645(-)